MITMALIGLLLAATVAAPASSPPAQTTDNRSYVAAVRDMLASDYPIAEASETYASTLNRNIAAGRYKGLAVCGLRKKSNTDLQSAHRDLHLSVSCKHADSSKPPFSATSRNPIKRADWVPGLPAFYVSSRSGW